MSAGGLSRLPPEYPNEEVVRFLARNFRSAPRAHLRALDVGVGGGRHTKLLADLGFVVTGVDASEACVRATGEWLARCGGRATLACAPLGELPLPSESFDVVLACEALQAAAGDGIERALAEIHRVLRAGGVGFVVLRTPSDTRDDATGLRAAEADVPRMFGAFRTVEFERFETTFARRRFVDSTWLVQVRK